MEVQLNKGTWYRVYTGHFERREDGNEYIAEKGLQGAKVIETPWANLIGIYSSPSERQEKAKLLHDFDYSPYVVKDDDGKERLYLGAFNERDRAQRVLEELKSKGIESSDCKAVTMAQYDINLREYWRVLKKRKLVISSHHSSSGAFQYLFCHSQEACPSLHHRLPHRNSKIPRARRVVRKKLHVVRGG